jgi:Na+/H+ antiporter NhaD/arsenite permease-like protein
MTIIISVILILALFFIATERITNLNKAAIAIFACTLGWVLYICFGTDFVMSQHPGDYSHFLGAAKPTSVAVKHYIATNVFLPYLGMASEIALFLLVTMTVIGILYNNGCFDFLSLWIRTRNSRLLMLKLTAMSFFLSANMDNVSTIVLMLTITNAILPRTRDRMVYGSMVLLAVIYGGALTVIGDPTGLLLWNKGVITASDYTLSMAVPCAIAWLLPTIIVTLRLPETVQVERPSLPYRGDDTNLNLWQRVVMFLVGIGGLWFIPTFHAITKLPPCLGALCVLSLLWIVNEVFNRKLFAQSRQMRSGIPQLMQYNALQQILYIIGMMLAVAVVSETGALHLFAEEIDTVVGNIWIIGAVTALISTVLDSFASCLTMVSLHDVSDTIPYYSVGGAYWKVLSFGTAVGGSILALGSIAGIVAMNMEGIRLRWYIRNIAPVTLLGGAIAFVVLCLELI